jgi:TRAP-type mannitol/chloroaromatic compound transport system permease small subunit
MTSQVMRAGKATSPVRQALRGIEVLAAVDGWMGVACLASLILLMLAEVSLRALSNVVPAIPSSIPAAWEYCSYLMAACFTFGAAMTLRTGGHIRVNLIHASASPALRKLLEIAAAAVGFVSVGFLGISMVRFTWVSFADGQVSADSGTVLWVPQMLVTFGILLLALQMLARLVQAGHDLPLEDERMKPTASLE